MVALAPSSSSSSAKSALQKEITTVMLGSVGIQDSHPGLFVIQALDGPIRFDRRSMGENRAALSR
jgi:hypothetical protein